MTSEEFAAARRASYQRKNLKRRAPGLGDVLSIRELADRDAWVCHLCTEPVDCDLAYPDPMSASRDHLIPVADGGTNDRANLALAHWICNVRRSTGGVVQLQLFG